MSVSLQERLGAAARMVEFAGASTAADFGDPRAEFFALLTGCGLYELNWRSTIVLTGSDRLRWLNGMVTNNIRDLAPGHGVYAFQLNAQGRILGDLYAYNCGESLIVDSDVSQIPELTKTFDRYIIMDDVELADGSNRLAAIGVQGPKSRDVLRAAGLDVPELLPLQFVDTHWHGICVTVVRAELWKGDAYELWLAPDKTASLWDALREAGAQPAGIEAQRLYRIASGIPRYGEDIRERDLPQETGQDRALNFAKGCYVGQEIVERIRSRGQVHRLLMGFEISGPLPEAGTKIQVEGKDVGEVTNAAAIPTRNGDRNFALGYLRREAASKTLQIGTSNAKAHPLPFRALLQ